MREPEHSTYVTPATGLGPMRGHRWNCRCGRSGKTEGRRETAERKGVEHVERMARRAAAP